MANLDLGSLFPSKYQKADDLDVGESRQLTIRGVSSELMPDGTSKAALSFAGDTKPFILNKTNTDCLMNLFGRQSDGCVGKTIVVYRIENVYQGKPGLRLRAPSATDQEAEAAFV